MGENCTNIQIYGVRVDVLKTGAVTIFSNGRDVKHESPLVHNILKYLVAEGFILNHIKSMRVTIQKQKIT